VVEGGDGRDVGCGGGWGGVGEKQIPGGNDTKKSKSKSPGECRGFAVKRGEELSGFFGFCFGGCRGNGALGFVAWLADVDAALEEGAVFDRDASGDDVAGEGTFAADVNAIGGLAVAANFAEDDDLAGADVRGYLAIAADGNAVAGEVDSAFDFTVDVERFGTGDFAFDN
jgi:hypothetical protein